MLSYANTKSRWNILNSVEPLKLNLNDEQKMADWIKMKYPDMLDQMWAGIESSTITA